MRLDRALAGTLLGLGLLAASPAAALQITLAGPGTGPLTGGLGSEDATPGSSIVFTVGLDAVASIQGYDVTLAWDAAELSFVSASELSGIGFARAPSGATPAGERVAAIALPSLPPVATDLLFSLTFDVTAVLTDGAADFAVFVHPPTNGGGIAPGSLGPLANPAGAAIAVPGPGAAPLLLLAGALLRRARRSS